MQNYKLNIFQKSHSFIFFVQNIAEILERYSMVIFYENRVCNLAYKMALYR